MYNTCMTKKLTIVIADEVYDGLYAKIGPRKIGHFLENLARPHVIDSDLEAGYAAMAADEVREAQAQEWVEAVESDIADEPR